MECLGLHNKPTAEVHPGHKLTGPKEEEEEEEECTVSGLLGGTAEKKEHPYVHDLSSLLHRVTDRLKVGIKK
jgi:hypothetical protein